ncbi:protein WVD2-like 4 isoform X2 [Mangifera indica]|uniref:protein WVD2-like 4 isoform X2 n=1 Tax=Mangifera indica TaxID=29780 RepID=UPI001CFB2807|nr:protein WVD2-like 4 isoform X2 [Mangifera indica]
MANSKPLMPVRGHERSSKSTKIQEAGKLSENSNPNVSYSSSPYSSPGAKIAKPTSSPLTKSAKLQKSVPRIVNPLAQKINERKFVVAKKRSKDEKKEEKGKGALSLNIECKCKGRFSGGDVKKCPCVAYENLRASQEEFFKNKSRFGEEKDGEFEDFENVVGEETKGVSVDQNIEDQDVNVSESAEKSGSCTMKRRRAKLLEEARNSVPECGKVLHLVKAFEKLLSIPNSKENEKESEKKSVVYDDDNKKAMKWALPGLQAAPPKVNDSMESSVSSFSPSDLILTAENLGLDSVSSSWDSCQGSRTSNGGRRSRRNSFESCGTMRSIRWKQNQLKATCQKPFKLRTEQRGRQKEEDFMKKIQEMVQVEEKLRIPVAQGLPWTTDEPECLIKPPVKENTRPIDLKLHSDLRAMERAEFDHQVAEKMSLIEQYRTQRDRQQKLEEDEEIKRLRKELVPKAQPMPYFDRPFVPRRSMKHPTMPREPKFQIPAHHKKIKCCESWNDMSSLTYQQQQ